MPNIFKEIRAILKKEIEEQLKSNTKEISFEKIIEKLNDEATVCSYSFRICFVGGQRCRLGRKTSVSEKNAC